MNESTMTETVTTINGLRNRLENYSAHSGAPAVLVVRRDVCHSYLATIMMSAVLGRQPALRVKCAAGRGESSQQHGANGRGKYRCRAPGTFEVRVISPPPRSLGIYSLPPLTNCDEEIEVDGQGFVVKRVVIQMKLNKGKYVRDHSRLDVTPTGRYFLEKSLENLMRAKYVGPTGLQD